MSAEEQTQTAAPTHYSAPSNGPLIELDESEQHDFVLLGERLLGEGRYDDAARAFHILLAADPSNGFYHRALGVCCEALGLFDNAKMALDSAITIDDKDSYARACRASILLRNGDAQGAAEDLRNAQMHLTERDVALKQRIDAMLSRLAA